MLVYLFSLVTFIPFAMMFDVKGKVNFKDGQPSTIPPGSWLSVKAEDTSLQDVPAILLGKTEFEVKDYNSSKPLEFFIQNVKKPDPQGEVNVSFMLNIKCFLSSLYSLPMKKDYSVSMIIVLKQTIIKTFFA